jgi:hypothetical protein
MPPEDLHWATPIQHVSLYTHALRSVSILGLSFSIFIWGNGMKSHAYFSRLLLLHLLTLTQIPNYTNFSFPLLFPQFPITSWLLGSWTLSNVWHYKQKHPCFGTCICFRPQVKEWEVHFYNFRRCMREPRYRSRCSDWLLAGRHKGRNSSPSRFKSFHFSVSSRPALWSTQPPIQWVKGTLSQVIERLGREADHSSPTSAEVEITWGYTPTFPYAFMT